MPKTPTSIWAGAILRLFAGPPNPKRHALFLDSDGSFHQSSFGRNDLCNWDADSVVLSERLCWTDEGDNGSDLPRALSVIVKNALEDAATTLRQLPLEMFDLLRQKGRSFDILIAVHTPEEELSVPLPIDFLKRCFDLGLAIEVYTDHFSRGGRRKRKKASQKGTP